MTHRHGALLTFDDIITGFRMSLGGAQQYFGVTPDLAAYGKAMGNGMPISAVVGKAEIMRLFEDVFFSFTFGGEVLSIAASIATIQELLRTNPLKHIWERGKTLLDGYNLLSEQIGLTHVTKCIGYQCWPELVFIGPDGVPWTNAQSLFRQEFLKRGILTRAGMFVCYAHSVEDVRTTLSVFHEALEILREAIEAGNIAEQLEGEVMEPVIRSTVQALSR